MALEPTPAEMYAAWGIRCATPEEFALWAEGSRNDPDRAPTLAMYCGDATSDFCALMHELGKCVRRDQCKAGHPQTDENRYRDHRGAFRCKVCLQLRRREWKSRRKTA